jgi:hypothetical protein
MPPASNPWSRGRRAFASNQPATPELPMSSAKPIHRLRPSVAVAAACGLALCSVIGSSASAQERGYSVERHGQAPTSGVVTIRIENGSGRLTINGRNGATSVNTTAVIRGASQQTVNAVRLVTDRSGDVITVRADGPDHESWDDGWSADLTLEVPSNVHLEVNDGSGGARLENVGALTVRSGSGGVHVTGANGPVEVRSGSGGAQLRNVRGDVSLTTGSGAIVMEGVTGSVDVRSAGSGSLEINHVTGTVHIGSIGSGTVTADAIGGDFTVDRKGSGSVNYTNVKGRVDVPSRNRNRNW